MIASAKQTLCRLPDQKRGERQTSSANRKVRPKRKTMTGLWIALMAVLFIEALFYTWSRVQCVNAGVEIDRQTHHHQTLLKSRNTLRIELARLKSPERIETIARTRLGLVTPDAKQTVTLP